MSESLADLHARYPYDRDERYWQGSRSLEEAIAIAGDLHLQPDPLTYLDAIREQDHGHAIAVNDALLFLPPEAVIENFGEEVGLWTSLASSISGDNKAINAVLAEKYAYDLDDLEIARGWVWRHGFSASPKQTLAQYGLMQSMKQDVLARVDLSRIVYESAKDGIKLSESRIADYTIEPIEVERYNSYYDGGQVKGWDLDRSKAIGYDSWLDAPTGFALMYKGVPNAMAGLAMSELDEVMVHQLQGVQRKRVDLTKSSYSDDFVIGTVSSRGLYPLDWQKTLVTVAEHIAIETGATRAGILAAKNNVWIRPRMPSDTEPHLPIDKAIQAYDEPARRLGYEKDSSDKKDNWHKRVA